MQSLTYFIVNCTWHFHPPLFYLAPDLSIIVHNPVEFWSHRESPVGFYYNCSIISLNNGGAIYHIPGPQQVPLVNIGFLETIKFSPERIPLSLQASLAC
ncbi:unnamed protein product, partial [marine sediment metagenome]